MRAPVNRPADEVPQADLQAAEPRIAGWRFANVQIDAATREVRVHGEVVDIEPKPYQLLMLLLERAGEVVTAEEILAAVWTGRVVNNATIPNNIAKVRRALRDEHQAIIVTVPTVGYRLVATVTRSFASPRKVALPDPLKAGDSVPGRPHWVLDRKLNPGGLGEAWVAVHRKTRKAHVFKFCVEPSHLNALKREVTIFRLLKRALEDRAPVVDVVDWQFEAPPFFIESEFGGLNLRAWAESQGGLAAVPLATRIGLARRVAESVGATHSVAVLHKDLKPENILLRETPEGVVPQLCDFGAGDLIDRTAHALGAGVTIQGFTTDLGAAAKESSYGTFMYLAPELLAGTAASIQSDVYALGVLLYQLVVGDWRPIATGWEADIHDPLLRADIADATHGIPGRRLGSAQMLAERLETLAERRTQLDAADRAAAREREIVAALGRAQVRRPWIVAAGSILTIALAAISVLFYQASRSARFAEEQRLQAQQLSDFVAKDIVHSGSPDFGGRYDVTLKEAVLKAVPMIRQRLAPSPAAEAVVSQSIAAMLFSLSEPQAAAPLAQRAGDLYAGLYGPDDPRTLAANLDEIVYRMSLSAPTGIRPLAAEVLARLNRAIPENDPLRLTGRHIQAQLHAMDGNVLKATEELRALVNDYPRIAPNDTKGLDEARFSYLRHLNNAWQWSAVAELADRWRPEFAARYGERGRLTLKLKQAHARALSTPGGTTETADYRKAVAMLTEVRKGYEDLYGSRSLEVLKATEDLADADRYFFRWGPAIEAYERLMAEYRQIYGAGSQWTVRPFILRTYSLVEAGRSSEALASADALIGFVRGQLSSKDYVYRHALAVSANAYLLWGREQTAAELLDELERISPPAGEDPLLSAMLDYLRGIQAEQRGQPAKAIQCYTAALNWLQRWGFNPAKLDALARLKRLKAAETAAGKP